MGFWDSISPLAKVGSMFADAGKFLGERLLPPKKMSESEKADKYANIFAISEASTDSARQMFATEMKTQKQPWAIRLLNGFVRPCGGIGALTTEFYVIWGENFAEWFHYVHKPIHLDTNQHLILAAIIGFYFGSRLKETLTGSATRR